MPDNWISTILLTGETDVSIDNVKVNDLIELNDVGGVVVPVDETTHPILWDKLGGTEGDVFWAYVEYLFTCDNPLDEGSVLVHVYRGVDDDWSVYTLQGYASSTENLSDNGRWGKGISNANGNRTYEGSPSVNKIIQFPYGTGSTLDFSFKKGVRAGTGHTVVGKARRPDSGGVYGCYTTLSITNMMQLWDYNSNLIVEGAITSDDWQHVAFTRLPSGDFQLYIDGNLVDSNLSVKTEIDIVGQFRVGGDYNDADRIVDEIRYTSAARYTSDFTPPDSPNPTGASVALPNMTPPVGSHKRYKIIADMT